MLCAEDDHSFGPDARRRAVDVLVEGKKDYTLVLYGGIAHGFTTRADPRVPKQSEWLLRRLPGLGGRADAETRRVGEGAGHAERVVLVQPPWDVFCVSSE